MSQNDMNIANSDGATVRADLNNALAALVGLSGGASAPSTTFANMLWADTTAGLLKMRNQADSAWITVGTLDATNLGLSANAIEQGKHTIFIPAGAMRPTVSNGCAILAEVETTAGRPDLQVLDFDATADEHAQFGIAFPKSWDEGTVTFRAFWTSTATDTDGVAWALQGVATANDDTMDVAYGTAVVVTDDNISAAEDMLVTAESAAITIAGAPAADEMVHFRLFRDVSDAADTMTEDARLIGIQVFYTLDAGTDV